MYNNNDICIVQRFDLHCQSMDYIKIDVIIIITRHTYHYHNTVK